EPGRGAAELRRGAVAVLGHVRGEPPDPDRRPRGPVAVLHGPDDGERGAAPARAADAPSPPGPPARTVHLGDLRTLGPGIQDRREPEPPPAGPHLRDVQLLLRSQRRREPAARGDVLQRRDLPAALWLREDLLR